MASIQGVPNCDASTSTFNTGVPLCDIIRKAPKGLIFLDKGVSFSGTDFNSISAFVTALSAKTRAARGSRAYPMWDLTNYEDQTKEATKASIGNLTTAEVTKVNQIPAFTFQHYKGELFHQQLITAETASLTLLIVDEGNVVYGTRNSDGSLTGYEWSEFKAAIPKFATATETAKYSFSIQLASKIQYQDNMDFVQLDSTVASVTGLIPVTLKEASIATNTISVKAIARGGKSMGVNYGTELADTDAWVVTKKSDGSSVTTSGVTYNSTTDKFAIVTSGLSTGDIAVVALAAADDLSTLLVDGYEGANTVEVTKA